MHYHSTVYMQITGTASPSGDISRNSMAAPSEAVSLVTSIVPTTGGQGESDATNAGLAAGVAVGAVLAVVLVAVVVAMVLAAVCSTQQRRKRSGHTSHVPADTLLATD